MATTTAPATEVIVSLELSGLGGPRSRDSGTAAPDHPLPACPQPWQLFEEKMKAKGLSKAAVDAFKQNYEQLVAGVTGLVRGRAAGDRGGRVAGVRREAAWALWPPFGAKGERGAARLGSAGAGPDTMRLAVLQMSSRPPCFPPG